MAPTGKTFTSPTWQARARMSCVTATLSLVGDVFGITQTDVNPPAAADLERLARIAHEQLRARADRALVHADQAHLADVGVDRHLEHVREHVAGRVRYDLDRHRVLARALEERRQVALGGVGRELAENVQ